MATLEGMAAGPSVCQTPAAESTRFEADDRGGIVVDVMLDGRGPFRMLFDTGSTHSAITADVRRALEAPLVARATLSTVSGATDQPVARIDRLCIGPVVASGVMPTVIGTSRVEGSQRLDGVVGQDVLAAVSYTIDYSRRRIVWYSGPPPVDAGTETFELTLDGGRFVIDLPQRDRVLRLVPDTGSERLVLFGGVSFLQAGSTREGQELSTLNGIRPVRQVRLRELRIGAASWFDVPAVLVPQHGAGDTGVDGLLPLHMFRRVTFDGPRRRLHIS